MTIGGHTSTCASGPRRIRLGKTVPGWLRPRLRTAAGHAENLQAAISPELGGPKAARPTAQRTTPDETKPKPPAQGAADRARDRRRLDRTARADSDAHAHSDAHRLGAVIRLF